MDGASTRTSPALAERSRFTSAALPATCWRKPASEGPQLALMIERGIEEGVERVAGFSAEPGGREVAPPPGPSSPAKKRNGPLRPASFVQATSLASASA